MCQRLGCVSRHGVRIAEEKSVLAHNRLVTEEDWWDEVCGGTAWFTECRAGGVPGVVASWCSLPAAVLYMEQDMCCVLVCGVPHPERVVSPLVLLC